MKTKESNVKKYCIALLVLLLVAAALFLLSGWRGGHFDSVESMRDYIAGFGLLGPIMLVLIQALQVIVPVIPGFVGCLAGAGLFGAWGSFLCNYIGICLGSLIAFLLARHYGARLVRLMFSEEQYDRYLGWLAHKKSFILVLWLSILLPLAPDDFLCYFSGLTGMSFRKFTWIILLAKPWVILAYCFFFEKLF